MNIRVNSILESESSTYMTTDQSQSKRLDETKKSNNYKRNLSPIKTSLRKPKLAFNFQTQINNSKYALIIKNSPRTKSSSYLTNSPIIKSRGTLVLNHQHKERNKRKRVTFIDKDGVTPFEDIIPVKSYKSYNIQVYYGDFNDNYKKVTSQMKAAHTVCSCSSSACIIF